MIYNENSAFSPDQTVLNFCSTAAWLLTANAAILRRPAVGYANRSFGHLKRYTKHLALSNTGHQSMGVRT